MFVAVAALPEHEPEVVALVAEVAVAALPLIEIDQVPEAFVPVVLGAPTVLKLTVRAALPLKVVPETSPDPLLLNVTELVTDPAVVADVAVVALVAVVADVALVAVAALPLIEIDQVPDAPVPSAFGAPTVL